MESKSAAAAALEAASIKDRFPAQGRLHYAKNPMEWASLALKPVHDALEVFRLKPEHPAAPGWGVRTTRDLPEGVDLGRLAGTLIHLDAHEPTSHTFRLTDKLAVDGKDRGNMLALINDPRCTPSSANVYARRMNMPSANDGKIPTMAFITSRAIQAGDEILVTYGKGHGFDMGLCLYNRMSAEFFAKVFPKGGKSKEAKEKKEHSGKKDKKREREVPNVAEEEGQPRIPAPVNEQEILRDLWQDLERQRRAETGVYDDHDEDDGGDERQDAATGHSDVVYVYDSDAEAEAAYDDAQLVEAVNHHKNDYGDDRLRRSPPQHASAAAVARICSSQPPECLLRRGQHATLQIRPPVEASKPVYLDQHNEMYEGGDNEEEEEEEDQNEEDEEDRDNDDDDEVVIIPAKDKGELDGGADISIAPLFVPQKPPRKKAEPPTVAEFVQYREWCTHTAEQERAAFRPIRSHDDMVEALRSNLYAVYGARHEEPRLKVRQQLVRAYLQHLMMVVNGMTYAQMDPYFFTPEALQKKKNEGTHTNYHFKNARFLFKAIYEFGMWDLRMLVDPRVCGRLARATGRMTKFLWKNPQVIRMFQRGGEPRTMGYIDKNKKVHTVPTFEWFTMIPAPNVNPFDLCVLQQPMPRLQPVLQQPIRPKAPTKKRKVDIRQMVQMMGPKTV
jgi:hypothetical protein